MAERDEDILNQWLEGTLSNEDLEKSISREDSLVYQQILSEVDSWEVDDSAYQIDPKQIIRNHPKKSGKTVIINWPIRIAAAIALLVASFIIWKLLPEQEVVYTAKGTVLEVLLPDSTSKAHIAPGSQISLLISEWKSGIRSLNLQGQAYFDVPVGGEFMVSLDQGNVKVLGTRFETSGSIGWLQVKCYEGSVEATAKSGQKLIVNAGEGALFYAEKWEQKSSISGDEPTWINELIEFQNAPIEQVITQLSSIYQLKVDLGDINSKRRFTGTLPTSDVEKALTLFCGPMNIQWQLQDNRLILSE